MPGTHHLAAVLRRHYPDAPIPTHAPARAGDIRHSVGAPQRARAELHFTADTPLEAGLAALKSASVA